MRAQADVVFLNQLGEGTYGDVYLASALYGGPTFALKMSKEDADEELKAAMNAEATVQAVLGPHSGIVRVRCATECGQASRVALCTCFQWRGRARSRLGDWTGWAAGCLV